MDNSRFGGRIVHPTYFSTDYFDLILLKWGRLSGLHAKHSIELINPARVGSKVRVTGKVVDKYVKRGRKYFELVYQVIDQDGREIVRNKYTGTV